ncbi:MAG: FRG domain-containing protein [Clostridiales bacterium]|nr:FRG domain-containing protein [Clostridiales bacterium]
MLHNNEIINKEQIIEQKIIQKISDAIDVNYNVSQIKIDSFDDFYNKLYLPYKDGEPIYYRGERRSSPTRKLLPTFLRTNEIISTYNDMPIVNLDYQKLCDFYCGKSRFMSVYKTIYSNDKEQNIYNMLAFAQHYLGISPFIDFSKSLFVALSFALKDRDEISENIVIYTALDIDCDDTSNDIDEVTDWLENLMFPL